MEDQNSMFGEHMWWEKPCPLKSNFKYFQDLKSFFGTSVMAN